MDIHFETDAAVSRVDVVVCHFNTIQYNTIQLNIRNRNHGSKRLKRDSLADPLCLFPYNYKKVKINSAGTSKVKQKD